MNHDSFEDDSDWLALLAGRPAPNARPETQREAQALRKILLQREARHRQETDSEEHRRAYERLLIRLRAQGLMPASRRRWWQGPALIPALAASVALVTLALPLLKRAPPPTDTPVFKGFQLPQAIHAARPRATARSLAADLKRLGIEASLSQKGDAMQLQASLPPRPSAALQDWLRHHGLRATNHRLRVLILPPRPEKKPD